MFCEQSSFLKINVKPLGSDTFSHLYACYLLGTEVNICHLCICSFSENLSQEKNELKTLLGGVMKAAADVLGGALLLRMKNALREYILY